MRIRRLNIEGDRVKYALNKKLLKKLGWQHDDVVDQIPLKLQQIALFNISLNERLKGREDYQDLNDFKLIAQISLERQQKFLKLKKRHSKKGRLYPVGKGYALDLSKLNRGLLTEEQATGKEKIPLKTIRSRIKMLNSELRILKSELNSRKKSKSQASS